MESFALVWTNSAELLTVWKLGVCASVRFAATYFGPEESHSTPVRQTVPMHYVSVAGGNDTPLLTNLLEWELAILKKARPKSERKSRTLRNDEPKINRELRSGLIHLLVT